MKWAGFLFFILFASCIQREKKAILRRLARQDSLKIQHDSDRLVTDKVAKTDSLLHDSLLKKTLQYANNHRREAYYKTELKTPNDSIAADTLTFGHLFSKDRQHLMVKIATKEDVYIDIFVLEKSGLKPVLHTDMWRLEYVADTLMDVNGDHYKDFILHWFPSSGCCPRNRFDVYTYDPNKGAFSPKYGFLNPTFFPKEKTIRGFEYGHPGEVALYKYKWRGSKIDTVEFILPDTITKKYHVFKHWDDFDNTKIGTLLKRVPKEYLKINGYDWFKSEPF